MDDDYSLSNQYVEYLKLIKDNWSSCHAAKVLSFELICYLEQRFLQLSAPLRVRILTSFLYIKESIRVNCCDKILKILELGETDSNEWVRKMSRLSRPYIKTGIMDLKETDTETAFRIINFLDDKQNNDGCEYAVKPGLEYVHICDISDTQVNHGDEYTLFMPRRNFDIIGAKVCHCIYID